MRRVTWETTTVETYVVEIEGTTPLDPDDELDATLGTLEFADPEEVVVTGRVLLVDEEI